MILKIAVVNDIHAGKQFSRDGHMRAASHLVENHISETFGKINHHQPDVVINMGDLIRKEAPRIDFDRYHKMFLKFSTFKIPVIHMLVSSPKSFLFKFSF